MWPGAAVSGWYFCHPQSQYFVVGRLGRDQVAGLRRAQGLDPRRGRALALAEPRLRPRGLMRRAGRPLGHGRHPRRHRAVLDRDRVRDGREVRRHLEPASTPCELVGNDLVESGRYIRELMGLDLAPRRSSRSCSTAWSPRSSRRCRGGPARSSCWLELREAGVPLRPGHDVLPAVRGADPGPPAARDVPGGRHRRPGRAGKPHPEPYLTAAAALGVPPGGLRGHRGLQHRRQVGRGGRLPGAGRREPRAVARGPRRVFRDTRWTRRRALASARTPSYGEPGPQALPAASPRRAAPTAAGSAAACRRRPGRAPGRRTSRSCCPGWAGSRRSRAASWMAAQIASTLRSVASRSASSGS